MADTQTGIDVRIRTEADTAGARAAERALKEVGEQADKTGASATDTGRAVNDLGENFEKGAGASRAFAAIMRGDVVGGLAQLAPVLKGLGALLRANLLGVLITITAAAVAFFREWKSGVKDAEKSSDDLTRTIDQARDAAARLGEQRLDTLNAELERIATSARQTIEDLQASLAAAEALADAQDRLDLARIESDPNLSEEEKVNRRAAIADRAAERRSATAVAQAEGVVGARRGARDEAQAAESEAAGRFSRASDSVQSDKALREATARELAKLVAELAQSRSGYTALAAGMGPEGTPSPVMVELAQKITELESAVAATTTRQNLLTSPEGESRRARFEEAASVAAKELAKANDDARKTADELAAAEKNLARVRSQQEAVGPVEKEIRTVETERAAREARARDIERRQRTAREGELELLTADQTNMGARGALRVGRLANEFEAAGRSAGMQRPENAELLAQYERVVATARAAAEDGSLSADEGRDLAKALETTVRLLEQLGATAAGKESVKAVGRSVVEMTNRLQKVESQIATLRTR